MTPTNARDGHLQAVLDDDLEDFLRSIGELDRIQAGEAACCECGQPLNLRNLQLILPTTDGPFRYICDGRDCIRSYVEHGGAV